MKRLFPSDQASGGYYFKDRPHWQELRYEQYLEQVGPNGAMFVGNPDQVSEKLIRMIEDLGLDRFMLHLPLGSMPHEQVLRAIELFGTQVAPKSTGLFCHERGLIKS